MAEAIHQALPILAAPGEASDRVIPACAALDSLAAEHRLVFSLACARRLSFREPAATRRYHPSWVRSHEGWYQPHPEEACKAVRLDGRGWLAMVRPTRRPWFETRACGSLLTTRLGVWRVL